MHKPRHPGQQIAEPRCKRLVTDCSPGSLRTELMLFAEVLDLPMTHAATDPRGFTAKGVEFFCMHQTKGVEFFCMHTAHSRDLTAANSWLGFAMCVFAPVASTKVGLLSWFSADRVDVIRRVLALRQMTHAAYTRVP